MTIRSFQAGDDVAQVSIYNEAAAPLPKFKPATIDEVRRRCRAADFDPSTRLYALVQDKPVGYLTFHASGRVSYPWCRKGQEGQGSLLLARALELMKQRGIERAFAAYRADWPVQRDFFLAHGFEQTHEMINHVMDLVEMPTPAARASSLISPLTVADLPCVLQLGKSVLRLNTVPALEEYLFRNPYFPPSSLFALRSKANEQPVAVAIVVAGANYAHPRQVDSGMPCFRLGAFGTEGLTHKRIHGLFSLLAADTRDLTAYGLDLLGYASCKVEETDIETFAAQVPSSATHLARFYKSLFRRQGSFPIFERRL